MGTKSSTALCLLLTLIVHRPAAADVIVMDDGRRYEGSVLREDGGMLRIETKVSGVRVQLGLPTIKVKSREKKPLPPNFFGKPAAEERASDPARHREGQVLYLEVPIIGVLGKNVFAEALAPVLAYAVRHGIKHVVFTIDSTGGSIDEARELYDLLKEHRESLKYHALVKNCQAEALAVALWCRPNLILPGGQLGGLPPRAGEGAGAEEVAEEEIIRSQLVQKVLAETGASGHVAALVRALLNPGEGICAWKDEEGLIAFDAVPPPAVAADRIIVKAGKGEVLTIARSQALAMGMPDFQGGAPDLGKVLKLSDWAPESDYGMRTMKRICGEKERRTQAKETAHEEQVKRVVTRRDAADRFVRESLKQAAEWDPKKETYTEYSERYDWGWGWSGGWTSNKWTPESQKKWKSRTDACMFYLQETVRGLNTVKKLEVEAARLGLDPLYKPGEIDTMIRDLDVHYRDLGKNREKSSD